MTHVNDIYDAIMRELNNTVICDTDETTRLESSSLHEEMDEDDIPSSLLSYFERSKSRAAVCEKLILEEPEDFFASHHTEDMMDIPTKLDEDMMTLKKRVICDPVTAENNTSTDNRLLHAPTDPEDLLTHSVSVCPNNEGEAGVAESEESEKHYEFGVRLLEISLDEEENLESSGYEAEREKLRHEEVKEEEHRRQIEDDFQKELRRITEAEKLRQRELELMEKKAQEKLDQELLLQQEVISSLQRRVEEERRRMEEEKKRLKDEEDKRKRGEERMKKETERKRMEEAERRKKDEERKIQEMKLKEEEERKKVEDEKRRIEREEKRMREEKRLMALERKKLEDEIRTMKKEEERKKKEEEEKFKEEEEERRRMEEEQKRLKDEEDKRKREEERMKKEEVERRKKEEERKIQEINLKKEEERKKMEEEKRMREEKRLLDLEKKKLEDEMRMMKKEEERKKKEEEKKFKGEEVGKRDEERKKIEEVRRMERERRKKEQDMMKEEEDRKRIKEENLRPEEERRKMKENEERMWQKREEVERIRKEEGNKRESVEEAGKTSETEEKKSQDEMILKMKEGMERKTSIQEKMNKDTGKWNTGENENQEEEVKVDDQKQGEDERKDKEETGKEEQRTIREDKRRGNDDESKANEGEGTARLRDKEDYKKSEDGKRLTEDKEGFKGYDGDKREVGSENKTKDKERKKEEEGGKLEERKRENVEAEEKQVGRKEREKEIQVSKERGEGMRPAESERQKKRMESECHEFMSSPGPSHMKSAVTSISTVTSPQHDPDKSPTQTSTYNTVDYENQEERSSSVSDSLPAYLPEHTEQKRLSWMKECVPWSKLSLQNRRKQKGSHQGGRGTRRAVEASSLTPLCSDFLLQSTGWKSMKEVTTVTLEDLPGCSLSTLSQCAQLQSLTLRRCGLRSLEGVNQLSQLCYIDVQENKISFMDCENLTSLRVLKLCHNKLTSIHGLTGAENLEVLELSHNSITRIAGLESMKRLQKLSLDHNQLISTKGLKDVYTLLHLNCSHNHLVRVEGVENSALLDTLDLRANSLTEPPSLNNQVLLRELHLDDNSISSLQGLADCWVPLLQHLSVAQNRITQLPSMSDAVSLANLDLRFNCLSELQNVSESLEGCQFLRELHLTGNPLQQESGWRSTLQKALPGLRAIDDQDTDSFLSPPAVQQLSLASGSFLALCQAQLQQTHDVQQQHSRELSEASSPLDAVKLSCRHFTEALQLAVDQRFAHEYGDTSVADIPKAAGQTTDKKTLNVAGTKAEERTEEREIKCTRNVPPVVQSRDNIRRSDWTSGEKSAAESQHRKFSAPTASRANSDSINTSATKENTSSLYEVAPVSNQHDLNLQNKAAVMIQQLWRKYKQKCGNIRSPSTAEMEGGDGGKPESGPAFNNRSVQDYAATVIQAVWRGFTLRRRLASALAAVTCSDTGEDDTFEEVDVDEFVFDEATLEEHWTPLCEDPPSRSYTVSEQQLTPKLPEPSQHALPSQPVWRSKQAWVDEEQEDCGGQRVSPVSSVRSKPPASTPVPGGVAERSEKILEEWGFTHSHTALLMLKRAQRMKSKKQQQKKRSDPSALQFSFRNCSYQMDPAGAQNRRAKHKRYDIQVGEVELGLQLAEKTERVKQERAQQWLHTQAALADRDSESVRFLPEISAGILNGGRVQLVADPGYTERQHHASGLPANNSLAARPCKENSYPRSNPLGHARLEVPSPKRDSSAPSKKERISYRDNPVQLSGGWGGGKKRDRVHK